MNDLPPGCKILKSLIAPARYSDGPTLYLICQTDDENVCVIYEQLPDGRCQAWTVATAKGVQQAEGAIYRQAWKEV